MQPIFSADRPVFSTASFLASRGGHLHWARCSGSTWSHQLRKPHPDQPHHRRTGRADNRPGQTALRRSACGWRRVTSSAARATSNTSSKPICLKRVRTISMSSRLLNWPYSAGRRQGHRIFVLVQIARKRIEDRPFWRGAGRPGYTPRSRCTARMMIWALPSRTRIASVGQRLTQLMQPLHLSSIQASPNGKTSIVTRLRIRARSAAG